VLLTGIFPHDFLLKSVSEKTIYPLHLFRNLPMSGLLILLAFLMGGTLIQYWTSAPIPAAIIGMLLLLFFLMIRRKVPAALEGITKVLAPILPLFLIPVSVGIVTHEQLVKEHGLVLLLILAISLIPGTLVCGWIMSHGKRS
tara:strand:+ start:551 stop:976 length:426 start_codon:yes stop_codon:yes gene_type:complete